MPLLMLIYFGITDIFETNQTGKNFTIRQRNSQMLSIPMPVLMDSPMSTFGMNSDGVKASMPDAPFLTGFGTPLCAFMLFA